MRKFTQCVGSWQGKILGLTFQSGEYEHNKHRMCNKDFLLFCSVTKDTFKGMQDGFKVTVSK